MTREEVFAEQVAQEEEDTPEEEGSWRWICPGRSEARCRAIPPSAGHPAPAAQLGNVLPGGR